MAKKRKTGKKKTAKRRSAKKPEVGELPVKVDPEMLRGRYSNHIQVTMQQEEFVLDFFAKGGEQVTLLNRIFITPAHAKRLSDLVRRQLTLHKKQFGSKAKR